MTEPGKGKSSSTSSTGTSEDAPFDCSYLPEAELEFVLISDTHYMVDPGTNALEFESRRVQTARIRSVLDQVAGLKPSFVVHLGDVVQEFPEREGFGRAVREAHAQLSGLDGKLYLAAGNHDVGDKPDPTMPTDWVTAASLRAHHERYGCSWYAWDEGDWHGMVLNSQIMNTDLPEAGAQREWLESDLKAHTGRRIFVFLHLPPYLDQAGEPALGHYDNLAEPDRGWLLDLFRSYRVELVFAGHSHFSFFDRLGETRYYVAASTSFTRPGFSECFSSGPPAEQGRDDIGKLGFYLIRVLRDGLGVHFIRTNGRTDGGESSNKEARVITRLSRDLPGSPLGISLRHPLSQRAEVPIVFPSVIRQPIRNDYPLLACVELGVQQVRVPAGDFEDPFQRRRLSILREEGIRINAVRPWSEDAVQLEDMARHHELLDGVELQILGEPRPSEGMIRELRLFRRNQDMPLALSTVIPRERIAGKQHNRPRFGYRPGELEELNRVLSQGDVDVDRVLCRLDPDAAPWDAMRDAPRAGSFDRIGAVDWLLEFRTTETEVQNARAAEALLASALFPGSRLFVEPLVDLDRTMDITYGLLDRLCNPRSVFDVVRTLITVLFTSPEEYRPLDPVTVEGRRVLGIQGHRRVVYLVLPRKSGSIPSTGDGPELFARGGAAGPGKCFDLDRGVCRRLDGGEEPSSPEISGSVGPLLYVFP